MTIAHSQGDIVEGDERRLLSSFYMIGMFLIDGRRSNSYFPWCRVSGFGFQFAGYGLGSLIPNLTARFAQDAKDAKKTFAIFAAWRFSIVLRRL